jgi:esterase/lipase superfamily enzyme
MSPVPKAATRTVEAPAEATRAATRAPTQAASTLATPDVPGGTRPGTRRQLAGREVVPMTLAAGRATVQTAFRPVIADPLRSPTRSIAPMTRGVAASVAHAAVPKTDQNAFDVVPVFWGTDRKLPVANANARVARRPVTDTGRIETGSVDKVVLPGADRGDDLKLGRAYVTIPKVAREKGKILRPWQFTFLNVTLYSQSEDPNKHFTLGSFEVMDKAAFTREADKQLARSQRFKDQAFVFVHGFNNTFEDALYRTAQLAHDMEFDGTAYMYSWPSKGSETAYLYDRDSADRARRFFRTFLEIIAEETKAKKVHIIAHSLGNRPLLEVLRATGGGPNPLAAQLKLDQIVLAAPDIDRDLFVEIARQVTGVARGATLYASSKDRALQLSKKIAGGEPRAGDVPNGTPVIVPGVDSIDISAAGDDGWLTVNHATYAEGSHMLSDLKLLLHDGTRPPDRRFAVYQRQTVEGVGNFWRYVRN